MSKPTTSLSPLVALVLAAFIMVAVQAVPSQPNLYFLGSGLLGFPILWVLLTMWLPARSGLVVGLFSLGTFVLCSGLVAVRFLLG